MEHAKSVQERICKRVEAEISPNCMHRMPSGVCRQPEDFPCPIHSNMARIIEIVRSVSSERIDSYVNRLRAEVCNVCGMQDELGECCMRNKLDCCLDAFFVLVVRIVEEELAREQ